MTKLSEAQQRALNYARVQELNRYDSHLRYPTTKTLKSRTVAVLARLGLMEPFESTERKVRHRASQGVSCTATVKHVPVTRWRLTEKGRTLAQVNPDRLNSIGRAAYEKELNETKQVQSDPE